METTSIDKFGRVVVPKWVREEIGIYSGDELSVSLEGDRIILQPIEDPEWMSIQEGVTVFDGLVPGLTAKRRARGSE